MESASLQNFDSVDLVLRLPWDDKRVALLVLETGYDVDSEERERNLRKKLDAYLQFVATGQFAVIYPELSRHVLSVEVLCKVAPTPALLEIKTVGTRDFSLTVNVGLESVFRERLGLFSGPSLDGKYCS